MDIQYKYIDPEEKKKKKKEMSEWCKQSYVEI